MDHAYDRTPTRRSRELRNNPTEAEKRLWAYVRNRQVQQTRFNRQVPIGRYICDFVARSPKLVIELDGGQHAEQGDRDAARASYLEREGYRVLRFWNNDVLQRIEGVLMVTEEALKDRPSPNPSRDAGGEPR